MQREAMQIVRADLVKRIDGIAMSAGQIALGPLCDQLDTIRRIAHLHDLDAVERLASLIETAVAYHGHGSIILSYLDLMRDAAESGARGNEASTAYAAALSVRMSA